MLQAVTDGFLQQVFPNVQVDNVSYDVRDLDCQWTAGYIGEMLRQLPIHHRYRMIRAERGTWDILSAKTEWRSWIYIQQLPQEEEFEVIQQRLLNVDRRTIYEKILPKHEESQKNCQALLEV